MATDESEKRNQETRNNLRLFYRARLIYEIHINNTILFTNLEPLPLFHFTLLHPL
jgi:hypothetical protein